MSSVWCGIARRIFFVGHQSSSNGDGSLNVAKKLLQVTKSFSGFFLFFLWHMCLEVIRFAMFLVTLEERMLEGVVYVYFEG